MYLDPGFGSMLIQILIAALAGLGAVFAIFRAKIAAFFNKKKAGAKQEPAAPDSDSKAPVLEGDLPDAEPMDE